LLVAIVLTVIVIAVLSVPLLLTGAVTTSSSSGPVGLVICVTRGVIPGLSDDQAQNARVVAATATAAGGDEAALIALMVGITESGLRVLGNPHDPTADGVPVQGIGTDHDSLGIFQQRPSWGTAAQRLDPVASTNLFLGGWCDSAVW
jgi:hypothetical protein